MSEQHLRIIITFHVMHFDDLFKNSPFLRVYHQATFDDDSFSFCGHAKIRFTQFTTVL
jgi:hypothetical protein